MTQPLVRSPGVSVTLLLADYAVVSEGKLFISGGGWSVTGPGPAATAIALKLDVPWHMTNQLISIKMRLLYEDGQAVTQPTPAGEGPVAFDAGLEVGRPPGMTPGTPIDVPLAFSIPALQLPPGKRFSWELTIDDESKPEWHLAFSTRPQSG